MFRHASTGFCCDIFPQWSQGMDVFAQCTSLHDEKGCQLTSLQVHSVLNSLTVEFRSGIAQITKRVLLLVSGDILNGSAACCCVCEPVDQTGWFVTMETCPLCVTVQQGFTLPVNSASKVHTTL